MSVQQTPLITVNHVININFADEVIRLIKCHSK